MERRDFIRLGLVGAVGSRLFVSNTVSAEVAVDSAVGGIYFTQKAPGRWKGKEATHLPTIEFNKSTGKLNVSVITAHEMKGYEHYIVKHVLLNHHFEFLGEHLFDPTHDKTALSQFVIPEYTGELIALSMCNKHDVWVSSVKV